MLNMHLLFVYWINSQTLTVVVEKLDLNFNSSYIPVVKAGLDVNANLTSKTIPNVTALNPFSQVILFILN